MATITLRPTSATGTSWSNIGNAYDGSNTTSATVTVTSSNYTSRKGTFNFDTSVIPSGATINSATLTVSIKSSDSSRTTLYADVNENSSNRVINQKLTTSQTSYTANVLNYLNNLSSIVLTIANTRTTSYAITVYEVYITVDYTLTYTVTFKDWDKGFTNITSNLEVIAQYEKNKTNININIGTASLSKVYVGDKKIVGIYLGNKKIF